MILWKHIFGCLFFLCVLKKIDGIIKYSSKHFLKNYKPSTPSFTIHKASLSQKGYIQFLRYYNEVPTLTDYTFCIWVRSNNLTYSHPLLSYSLHEHERLIRVWISPFGTHANLEILDYPVFSVPVNLLEHQWYHICQSWSSYQGAWNFYFNGKLKASGFAPKLRGVSITGGGDIVVGQEYTDFDKGLDDGIEGDVFGFNFVLSSTSNTVHLPVNSITSNYPLRRQLYENIVPEAINIAQPKTDRFNQPADSDMPSVLSYFKMQDNGRSQQSILDVGRGIWHNLFNFHEPQPKLIYKSVHVDKRPHTKFAVAESPFYEPHIKFPVSHVDERPRFKTDRVINNIHDVQKPLGLLLVELSYDCAYRKGAPLSGEGVLINWTKTPVRVFGGAILKNIPPFCRK